MVKEFRDYLKFMNVILIEYFENLFQFIRCFTSNPKDKKFPASPFLKQQLDIAKEYKDCMENIDKDDYMKYCRNICNKFSYTTFSEFFDGNGELINKIVLNLYSFFRKLRQNEPLIIDLQKELE